MDAHGHYDLWLDNHVVLARIKGQWNDIMARQYAESFKEIVQPLIQESWAHIVYLDDWDLGTPEVEPIITELVEWVIRHGLKRTAQVYSPSMLKKFQMDRMVKETIGEFERHVFPKEAPAFEWLYNQGYPVTRELLYPLSA